jgi:antitoxin Phd
MIINTSSIVPITEANQNFSKVARLVDQNGSAVILKNNRPRYLLIDFSQIEQDSSFADEDALRVSRRIMEQNRAAYKELAQ